MNLLRSQKDLHNGPTSATPPGPFSSATDAANAMVDSLAEQFDISEETLGKSRIVRVLPAGLRTNHWYCDLHHSMFLILLSRAEDALINQKQSLSEHFIDTITIYWLIHSLMEEEGMALQFSRNVTPHADASAHAAAHVQITRWWNVNVLTPFKTGTASALHLRAALNRFFELVVKHITTMDQHSYGVNSPLTEHDISLEVAHIAESGLPLSPFMAGCSTLLSMLAPYMSKSLASRSISPLSTQPMKPLHLALTELPLWDGGKGAFRDMFVRQNAGCVRSAA